MGGPVCRVAADVKRIILEDPKSEIDQSLIASPATWIWRAFKHGRGSVKPADLGIRLLTTSLAGVNYFLGRSTNLSASPPFTLLAPKLSGQFGTTSFTDTNAARLTPQFYRVGVGN